MKYIYIVLIALLISSNLGGMLFLMNQLDQYQSLRENVIMAELREEIYKARISEAEIVIENQGAMILDMAETCILYEE